MVVKLNSHPRLGFADERLESAARNKAARVDGEPEGRIQG